MTKTSPYIFLVCLWPLAFVVIWAIWNSIRDSGNEKLQLRSLDRPETKGRVLSSEVVWAHVSVTYDYFVDGRRYKREYKISLTPRAPSRYGAGTIALAKEANQ